MRAGAALRPLLAVAALLVAACTSVPHASRERDAEAKQFNTHPGSATVYIYRPGLGEENLSSAESVLRIDGRLIGSTLPGSYFRVDLRAGGHELRGEGQDVGRLSLQTSAGELYFVSLRVVGGNSHFARVTPESGRQELARCCVLLENWAPGQRPLLY